MRTVAPCRAVNFYLRPADCSTRCISCLSVSASPGEKVERLYREVRAYAIPAGSEEIMLDLGIRQAIKMAPKFQAKM